MSNTPDRLPLDQQDDTLISLQVGGGDPLRITNFRPDIAEPSSVRDRTALVRAGRARELNLDDDALHTIARALTNPAAAASVIKQDLLSNEVIGPVDVSLLSGHGFLTEMFILLQPRAGGFAYDVPPPRIEGTVTEGGACPQLEITFHDEAHLRAFIKQTVAQTKAHGQDYSASILAKRVSRPVLAHVALVRFDNDAEPFMVLAVRDGITRVVSSWSALSPGLSVDELGEHIADQLLASKSVRGAAATETVARARGRERVAADLRARFAAGTSEGAPSEDAIRIRQTFTLPVQIFASMTEAGRSPVASWDRFEDTVQGVIGSIHGEFRPWETAATQSASILRAIPRAVHDRNLTHEVAEIATGVRGVGDVPEVFGEDAPADPLWRAIYLLCFFGHQVEFDGVKRHLRELTGASQIRNRTYVSHLATLIDMPWRRAKARTERQARRAWANGGALPGSFLGSAWDPVPTSDFMTLVAPALGGDRDARRTLQVGGGVALIADKLLMSNVGSALEAGSVPFRADVDAVIEGLGDSELGLCTLAHAANAFDADRQAINSFTKTELNATPGEVLKQAYLVPLPDRASPFRPAVDRAGKILPLTAYDVVYASNPARADAELAASKDKAARADAASESPGERATRLRKSMTGRLTDALVEAKELVTLSSTDGGIVGGPFGHPDDYRRVDTLVRNLQLLILANEPGDASTEEDLAYENPTDSEPTAEN